MSPLLSPLTPAGERALVSRFREGDEQAAAHFLELFWDRLMDYACRILGDEAQAEDVVQEAFIHLWEGRRRWEREDTLRPVLYRIVRNRALNNRRAVGIYRRLVARMRRSPIDPRPDPYEHTVEDELWAAVETALEQLPERRREIFVLVRYHEMSYEEVAHALDLSRQTVANQMSLALKDLRRLLDEPLAVDHPRDIPFPRASPD